jgi:hypothetical protein
MVYIESNKKTENLARTAAKQIEGPCPKKHLTHPPPSGIPM